MYLCRDLCAQVPVVVSSRARNQVASVVANLSPAPCRCVAFSQRARALINYLYTESHKKMKLVAA